MVAVVGSGGSEGEATAAVGEAKKASRKSDTLAAAAVGGAAALWTPATAALARGAGRPNGSSTVHVASPAALLFLRCVDNAAVTSSSDPSIANSEEPAPQPLIWGQGASQGTTAAPYEEQESGWAFC